MPETPTNVLQLVFDAFNTVTEPLGQITSSSVISSIEAKRWADTLLCLASEGIISYIRIWTFIGDNNMQYATFATRNLLEISIWTEYCSQSKENALRFFQDAVRDINGLALASEQLFTLTMDKPPLPGTLFKDAKERLKNLGRSIGVDELDHRYLHVSAAAHSISDETGKGFIKLNGILSKWAHPTALVVRSNVLSDHAKDFAEIYAALGFEFVMSILSDIVNTYPILIDLISQAQAHAL